MAKDFEEQLRGLRCLIKRCCKKVVYTDSTLTGTGTLADPLHSVFNCASVDACLGISDSGNPSLVLNQQGDWIASSATALTLQTDGVANGSQSLLNLKSGTNITLTDDGVGGVTIDASTGLSGVPTEVFYANSTTGDVTQDSQFTRNDVTHATLIKASGIGSQQASIVLVNNTIVESVTDGNNSSLLLLDNSQAKLYYQLPTIVDPIDSGFYADATGVYWYYRSGGTTRSFLLPSTDGNPRDVLATSGAGALAFIPITVFTDNTTIAGDGSAGSPLAAIASIPSLAATQIAYGNGSNVMTSSSDFIYNAGSLTVLGFDANEHLIEVDDTTGGSSQAGFIAVRKDSVDIFTSNIAGTITLDATLHAEEGTLTIQDSNVAANVSAILQLDSITKGFLPPRMTTTQRNAITGVEGLIVYDTNIKTPFFYNGTNWVGL